MDCRASSIICTEQTLEAGKLGLALAAQLFVTCDHFFSVLGGAGAIVLCTLAPSKGFMKMISDLIQLPTLQYDARLESGPVVMDSWAAAAGSHADSSAFHVFPAEMILPLCRQTDDIGQQS